MTRYEKLKKSLEAQDRAKKRQIEHRKAQLQDPEYIEKQRAERQLARKIAKCKTPEYRAQKVKKQQQAMAKAIAKRDAATATKPRSKPKTSRGLKGRSPTAAETKIMDAICTLPCLACKAHGRYSPLISYHHTDGRTKPNAHAKGLPLCAYHHDTPADKSVIAQYPDLIPIHARGTVGGRVAWEAANGTQVALLKWAYELLSLDVPASLFD